MAPSIKPVLISFKICPFVQRAAITLLEKGVEYDLEYVDLKNLPESFKAISPFGKVPVLRIGNESIFESAVINEYLDEVYEPRLHPSDPLVKARHRAWIEFASELTASNYRLMIADSNAGFDAELDKLKGLLNRLEPALGSTGPFFDGRQFSLVDAAFAPVFMRLDILDGHWSHNLFRPGSRLEQWQDSLTGRESVKASVAVDFISVFSEYFSNEDYYASRFLKKAAV